MNNDDDQRDVLEIKIQEIIATSSFELRNEGFILEEISKEFLACSITVALIGLEDKDSIEVFKECMNRSLLKAEKLMELHEKELIDE